MPDDGAPQPHVVDLRDGVGAPHLPHQFEMVGAAANHAPARAASGGLGWPSAPTIPRRPTAQAAAVEVDEAQTGAVAQEASAADQATVDAAGAGSEPDSALQDSVSGAAAGAPDGAGPPSPQLTPELFAELVKNLPQGYALIPVGYELRTAPPVKPTAKSGTAKAGSTAKGKSGARPAKPLNPWTLPERPVLVGSAITVLAMMLLVLASNALLIGHLKHVRDQRVALDDLRADLANGTAAVNQTDDSNLPIPTGKPLGILEIPALGLREVYLQGTTSTVLMSGVAHRRDTVMPGQVGTSVLYGRRTAFGGPFSLLDQLPIGSVVLVTNGLGDKLPFRVVGVRRGGDPLPQPPASGARVTLVTATGGPYQPDGTLRVDADFVPGPGVNGQQNQVTQGKPLLQGLTEAERPLAGDPSAWSGIVTGLLLLFPLTVGVAYARTRWGRWQAWLAGMPPLLAVGIFLTNAVIRLLPNLM